MDEHLTPLDQEEYLKSFMVFRVKQTLFAIRTLEVQAIQKIPEALTTIPDAASCVRGTFMSQGDLYTLVDLNQLFQWTTSEQDFQEFSQVMDARKNDHIRWVDALRKSYEEGVPFTLSKDCHACALGLWRDSFQTENNSVNQVLKRMDVPHGRLHALADKVLARDDRSGSVLQEIEQELKPQILSVLEEMKEEFHSQIFREMAILIRGQHRIGITADQLLGVEDLELLDSGRSVPTKTDAGLVRSILQRSGDGELVLELDLPKLISQLHLQED